MVFLSDGLMIAFVSLVVALYFGLLLGASLGARSRLPLFSVALGSGGWLLLTGLLARRGFFLDVHRSLPPHMAFALVPALGFVLYCTRSRRILPFVDGLPGRWIVGAQTFRVLIELILWSLAGAHLLPALMTFEGRNFDIIVGLTAPIVAWICFYRNQVRYPRLLIAWNVLGLLLLTNVVAHGILAMPTRFQVLKTEPSNALLTQFPFIWLPAFVVPVAYLLHVLSLRQVIRMKRALR